MASNNELIELTLNSTSTIGGSFQVIGKNSTLTGLVKEMEINESSHVIEGSNQVFIFRLNSIDSFNEEEYTAVYDSLRKKLLQRIKTKLQKHTLCEIRSSF